MNEIIRVLMERDGESYEEALQALQDARREVAQGSDPEDVLYEWFGLEPDFVFELIEPYV